MYEYLDSGPRSGGRRFTSNLEYVGIDKIRFIYPTHPYSDGSYDMFTKHKVKKTSKSGVYLEDFIGTAAADPRAPVYVELRNFGTEILVEYNPARQMDVNGDTLCHSDSVIATAIWVMQELHYAVMPRFAVDPLTQEVLIEDYTRWLPGWEKDCRLTRLDLARDIYSGFPGFGIDSLMHIRKSRHRNDYIYRNDGKAQTITWGSKNSARCSVYNKSLAHHNNGSGGWYRFEVQAHTETLKKFGLRTLDGVTSTRVEELLWYKWEQGNLGQMLNISEGAALVHSDLEKLLSPREVQTFLGVAFSLANGLQVGINERTLSKYRQIGKQIGFNLGDDLSRMNTKKVWIDFSKGEVRDSADFHTFTQTAANFPATI